MGAMAETQNTPLPEGRRTQITARIAGYLIGAPSKLRDPGNAQRITPEAGTHHANLITEAIEEVIVAMLADAKREVRLEIADELNGEDDGTYWDRMNDGFIALNGSRHLQPHQDGELDGIERVASWIRDSAGKEG